MNLRIKETFKEMFSEPRLTGFLFIYVMPMAYLISQATEANTLFAYKFTLLVSLIWFTVCFLIARFTLD